MIFRDYSKQSFLKKGVMEKRHPKELEHLKISLNSIVQDLSDAGIKRLCKRLGRDKISLS